MNLERILECEFLPADFAFERLESGVREKVSFEVALAGEGAIADFAVDRLVLPVCGLVSLQVGFVDEMLTADDTHMRLLSCVNLK